MKRVRESRTKHSVTAALLMLGAIGCGSSPTAETGSELPRSASRGAPIVLASIAAGDGHVCGLTTAGEAWCWGRNTYGELGDGTTTSRAVPTRVNTSVRFSKLSTTSATVCGLTAAGEGWCWGSNYFGNVGNGTLSNQLAPARVQNAPPFTDIGVGNDASCGLSAGAAWCWGLLGGVVGEPRVHFLVATATQESGSYSAIDPDNGQCALTGGIRWCLNVFNGQSFAGWRLSSASIAPYVQLNGCYRSASGQVSCAGQNREGEAGTGTTSDIPLFSPQPINSGLSFVQVGGGDRHRCARTSAGEVWCWGSNVEGETGNGTTTPTLSPVRVGGIPPAVEMAVGQFETCIRAQNGEVWCWGANYYGQLGDGTTINRSTPVKVVMP